MLQNRRMMSMSSGIASDTQSINEWCFNARRLQRVYIVVRLTHVATGTFRYTALPRDAVGRSCAEGDQLPDCQRGTRHSSIAATDGMSF